MMTFDNTDREGLWHWSVTLSMGIDDFAAELAAELGEQHAVARKVIEAGRLVTEARDSLSSEIDASC